MLFSNGCRCCDPTATTPEPNRCTLRLTLKSLVQLNNPLLYRKM